MPRLPELIKRYEAGLCARGYSPASVYTLTAALRSFGRFLEQRQITDPLHVTPTMLDDFRAELVGLPTRKGLPRRPSSVNGTLGAIRSFYHLLYDSEVIPYNPARRLKYVRQPERLPPPVLSAAEVGKLLDSIDPTTPLCGRDRAFFEMMYATGARRGEMLGMELDDLDLGERLVRIRKGKGGKQRVVPFGAVAANHVENYLRWVRPAFARKMPSRVLWLSHTGRRWQRDVIGERLKCYLRAAGIDKRLTPHGLRHACATHLLRRKADLRHIQELLGHASVESTQVYTHLEVQDLKETLARCHPRETDPLRPDGTLDEPREGT